MKQKLNLMLGCDPEIFLIDMEGKLRASCGLIGGTKRDPAPLPLGDGFAVQEDNVAIEFNIPPAKGAKEFSESIGKTLKFLSMTVEAQHGFKLHRASAESFPDSELVSPAALEFGCDPDYNAWTRARNPRPAAEDKNLRSCGGHIHIGLGDELKDLVEPEYLIKCMDFHAGVPSVLLDEGEKRKLLYGKRGAFRSKSYGVEYRTLSNFWVFEPKLRQWAWDATERAVRAALEGFPVDDYDEAIELAIDHNDKEAARDLVKEFKLEMVNV